MGSEAWGGGSSPGQEPGIQGSGKSPKAEKGVSRDRQEAQGMERGSEGQEASLTDGVQEAGA